MDDHTHIEIYRDEKSRWRWRFCDDWKVITTSESYEKQSGCEISLALHFGSVMIEEGRVVSVQRKYDTIPVDYL